MLECLIPYVDVSLKLPLALFIKFNEIRMIMNVFRSMDSLSNYGLNASTNSPSDMLCALTGISPEILNTIMSMSQNTNDFSNIFNNMNIPFSNTSFDKQSHYNNDTFNQSDNPFYKNTTEGFEYQCGVSDSIANIFAEYDMEQMQQEYPYDDTTYNL